MLKLFGIVIVLIVIGAGGFFFLHMKKGSPANTTPVERISTQESTATPQQLPASNSDTRDLKSYTNQGLGLTIKYPTDYSVATTSASKTAFDGFYLEKNVEIIKGGGMGGGDVLKKGAQISYYFLVPEIDLTEAEYKSRYGSQIIIKKIIVDGKEGTEVVLPNGQNDKYIHLQKGIGVIEISLQLGFENSDEDNQKFLEDFNQILISTKFVD